MLRRELFRCLATIATIGAAAKAQAQPKPPWLAQCPLCRGRLNRGVVWKKDGFVDFNCNACGESIVARVWTPEWLERVRANDPAIAR